MSHANNPVVEIRAAVKHYRTPEGLSLIHI